MPNDNDDRDEESADQDHGLAYISGARLIWLLDIGWETIDYEYDGEVYIVLKEDLERLERKAFALLNQFGRDKDPD